MAWPSGHEFNDAVQDPGSCFGDPDLWGEVAVDALGLPKVCSGNFAAVYQVRSADKSRQWAVKCFTKPVPDRHTRYSAIAEHLQRAALPFTVGFTYQEQGIRVRGAWYPVVKMEWVEGLTLTQFVRANLERPAVLDVLSQVWLKLAQRLKQAEVTHGDLQHGNVLLVAGSSEKKLALKLVDYDGLWVPKLAGNPSGELGLRDYQHPQRSRDNIYGPEVDRFSHLVIYTALRALRSQGKALWDRFDTCENLLFTARDFTAPGESSLLYELWRGPHQEVRDLAGRIVLAAQGRLADTPELADLVGPGATPSLTATQSARVNELVKAPRESSQAIQSLPAPLWVQHGQQSPTTTERIPPALGAISLPRRSVNSKVLAVALGAVGLFALITTGILILSGRPSPVAERPANPQPKPELKSKGVAKPVAGDDVVGVADVKEAKPAAPAAGADQPGENLQPTEKPESAAPAPVKPPEATSPGALIRIFQGQVRDVWSVALSPDGRRAVTGAADPPMSLWDVASGKEIRGLVGHSGGVRSVAFCPDGRHALSGGGDNSVRHWNVDTGEQVARLEGHKGPVLSVVCSRDGRYALSGSSDQTVRLWDLQDRRPVWICEGHSGAVASVSISPDARRALSAGFNDHTVRLWDLETGKGIRTFTGHTDAVSCVAFSPDGRQALSGSWDKTVLLWDLETGREIRRFDKHQSWVSCVAFSRDGRHALSGASGLGPNRILVETDTIRLWELATGQQVLALAGQVSWVRGVAFSPDDREALVGGDNGPPRLWRLPKLGTSPVASSAAPPLTAKLSGSPQQPLDSKPAGGAKASVPELSKAAPKAKPATATGGTLYKGKVTCAKCDLGTEKGCTTVLVTDTRRILYFDVQAHKKYHNDVCTEAKRGAVRGAVTRLAGKEVITVTEVRYD